VTFTGGQMRIVSLSSFDPLRTQPAHSTHLVFIAGAAWMHTSLARPGPTW
jgi:hypothetical protein